MNNRDFEHLVHRAVDKKLTLAEREKLMEAVHSLPPLEGALSYSDMCQAYTTASAAAASRSRMIQQIQVVLEGSGDFETLRSAIQGVFKQFSTEQPEVVSHRDLSQAVDNSTPYSVELIPEVCDIMARNLMAMFHPMTKVPGHPLWGPSEDEPELKLPAESF